MPLILDLEACVPCGAALTAAFIRDGLAQALDRHGLLGSGVQPGWDALRRSLLTLRGGGAQRVHQHVMARLAHGLGYGRPLRQDPVTTRDGPEDGGWLMRADSGARLRAWSVASVIDLDAPHGSGRAYGSTPTRIAQRVLLASGEPAGLLTNGETLRLLISDPSRADSHLSMPISGWREQILPPDCYRLLLGLAGAHGMAFLPLVLQAARLHQAKVTTHLRRQARDAVTGFINAVLDRMADRGGLDPVALWQQGLVLVYRLLFILKLEAPSGTGGGFSFASTRLWRTALSPNQALGPLVRRHLDHGADTGRMLESGLRLVFSAFRDGLSCSELHIAPLGGALFGAAATPLLDRLEWGERAVAVLLDRLIWTEAPGGERAWVHYGSLDVEDLGSVYEALLEQEPGIATEAMTRRRYGRLEAVTPRRASDGARGGPARGGGDNAISGTGNAASAEASNGGASNRDGCSGHGDTTRHSNGDCTPDCDGTQHSDWDSTQHGDGDGTSKTDSARGNNRDDDGAVGDIPAGRFFLRAGMGRKASGSFYTPHEFVRFLVRETLGPKVAALSPPHDPRPAALLSLRMVDPAIGSGHFLVEACRYLGKALLTACRLCDERGLHDRVAALPDADNTIAPYLPSRTTDGGSGVSDMRARAICRRLVAVHCLYGCDRNKLAVELAKLSLWLESYAEGLPLTFLDHRLIHGDALSGPFFESLSTLPVTGGALDPLLAWGVGERLRAGLELARRLVAALNASIGRDVADLTGKQATKDRLDGVLRPLRQLARAWSGAAMLRERDADDVWLGLARHVAATGAWPEVASERQAALLDAGAEAVAWDLEFPEVFPAGFSVVLGNPPWDVVQHNTKDFVAGFDPSVLTAATPAARAAIERAVLARPDAAAAFQAYRMGCERQKRIAARLYQHQRAGVGSDRTAGNLDLFRLFAERAMQLAAADGSVGVLLPSAFHANEGATGLRRLYFQQSDVAWCLSFENRRRIFDIDSRFKFDLVVARRPGPKRSLRCAFYTPSM